MDFEDGIPPAKPAWFSKETAEAIPYPGVVEKQTFDHELDENPYDNEESSQPSPARINRHREIARLSAMGRYTNNEIAARLGYSPSRISILLQTPFIQEEITRYRDAMFSQTIENGLKAMGPDALTDIHETILDKTVKPETRNTNSRWVLEKLTGKATQQVAVDHGGIVYYMNLLKEARETGKPIDITPLLKPAQPTEDATSEPEQTTGADQWSEWAKEQL